MNKQSSETERFLKALRNRHSSIHDTLGDDGVYGAMSGYTGQSHLGDAIKNNMLSDALTGVGVGALSGAYLLPVLGAKKIPSNYFKAGGLAGLAAGAGLSGLTSVAKYYLGKGSASINNQA